MADAIVAVAAKMFLLLQCLLLLVVVVASVKVIDVAVAIVAADTDVVL